MIVLLTVLGILINQLFWNLQHCRTTTSDEMDFIELTNGTVNKLFFSDRSRSDPYNSDHALTSSFKLNYNHEPKFFRASSSPINPGLRGTVRYGLVRYPPSKLFTDPNPSINYALSLSDTRF